MSGTRTLVIALVAIMLGYIGWRVYTRLPWIRIAATIHAERGALNCGDVLQSDGKDAAAAAINCAIAAHAAGRPFRVTFSVWGTDEALSSALVGDSQGRGTELMWVTGMVENPNELLRHRCGSPIQLQTTSDHPYGIPILHCAPWPPGRLERDWLFW